MINLPWPGSSLSLEGMTSTGALSTGLFDAFVVAFLLLFALALIVFYQRLVVALGGSLSFTKSANSAADILGNSYTSSSILLAFLLLVPFYALTLARVGVSSVGYWWTLVGIIGIFLFRKLVYMVMGWLTSRQNAVRSVEKISYGIFVMVFFLSLLAMPLVMILPNIPQWVVNCYLLAVAAISYFFYFKRSSEIIIQSGFSGFFWFLYLCALEILPVCVVVNILVNGN